MATQEEINKFVEAEMEERAIQAKINTIEAVIPADLEREKDAEIAEAHAAYLAVYRDHSKMSREEYRKAADPLIEAWKALKVENEAIKERNLVKTTAANAPIMEEKAALETQLTAVTEKNEEVFKAIPISTEVIAERI